MVKTDCFQIHYGCTKLHDQDTKNALLCLNMRNKHKVNATTNHYFLSVSGKNTSSTFGQCLRVYW